MVSQTDCGSQCRRHLQHCPNNHQPGTVDVIWIHKVSKREIPKRRRNKGAKIQNKIRVEEKKLRVLNEIRVLNGIRVLKDANEAIIS